MELIKPNVRKTELYRKDCATMSVRARMLRRRYRPSIAVRIKPRLKTLRG